MERSAPWTARAIRDQEGYWFMPSLSIYPNPFKIISFDARILLSNFTSSHNKEFSSCLYFCYLSKSPFKGFYQSIQQLMKYIWFVYGFDTWILVVPWAQGCLGGPGTGMPGGSRHRDAQGFIFLYLFTLIILLLLQQLGIRVNINLCFYFGFQPNFNFLK